LGDSVVVRVELSPAACGAIAQPRTLRASRDEGTLRLEVTPSTNDVCDEHWIVDLPAEVGIVARFDRADVDLRVRGGGIRISVGKGDIVARAEGGGYGRLRLAAEVGRVALVVDGRTVRHPRAPGPGDWVALEGAGGPEIVLETTVGNVRLRTGT
jgi:hypothetical protein